MRHWMHAVRSAALPEGAALSISARAVSEDARDAVPSLGVLRRNVGICLLCIGIAELCSVAMRAPIGLLAYALLLLTLLIGGALRSDPTEAALYLGFALVPLLRVLTLGLPLDRFAEQWTYVLVCVPVLFAVAVWLAVAGLSPASIRLRLPGRAWVVQTALIAASGIALG